MHLFINLFTVHPSVSIFLYISDIYLSIYPTYLSIYQSIFFFINPSIQPCLSIISFYLFNHLSIIYHFFPSIHLSIYCLFLFEYLSIYLSVYLSFYLYIYSSFYTDIYLFLSTCLLMYLSIYLGLLYPLRTPVCRPWERIRFVKNYFFCLNRNQGVRRPPYHVFVSCMRKFFLPSVKTISPSYVCRSTFSTE